MGICLRGLSQLEEEHGKRVLQLQSIDYRAEEPEAFWLPQVIARLLQGRGAREAVLIAEVLGNLKRGILDYLLQQVSWILQDGSTLWGRDDLAQVLQRRCSKPAASQPAQPTEAGPAGSLPSRHCCSFAHCPGSADGDSLFLSSGCHLIRILPTFMVGVSPEVSGLTDFYRALSLHFSGHHALLISGGPA